MAKEDTTETTMTETVETVEAGATKVRVTKAELVSLLAARLNVSKRFAGDVLGALTEVVTDLIDDKRVVQLQNLVRFAPREVAATPERKGRNPATKEEIMIPAKPARTKVVVRTVGALRKAQL